MKKKIKMGNTNNQKKHKDMEENIKEFRVKIFNIRRYIDAIQGTNNEKEK